jgi:hypothetical protein
MEDPTENARRARIAELNTGLAEDKEAARAELEKQYGDVWDTRQLGEEFLVLGYMAPFVMVRHKKTGDRGTLEFTHSPRFYFNWQEE